MRGRTIPTQTAHTTPRRARVPLGDLTLSDGRVCASLDSTPHGRLLHVSLSYPDRYPTWDDIKAVRYAFYPATVDGAMMLPADGYYVNVHEFCMQMWQTPAHWGIR